jgi:AraC-like DNA-binding protein/quercetin dioxygenase-like cupin family protein
MNNIPNISFEGAEDTADFELINLTQLFGRLHLIENHNPTHPHRITFFALLIVTNGTGKHQIDLKEYKIKPGTVLKIAKGQVHAFQHNPTYEGFLVLFTEEFVLNYFSKSSINLISHLYNYHTTSPMSENLAGNDFFLNHLKIELDSTIVYAQKNIIAALLDLYLLQLERKSQTSQPQDSNSKRYNTFLQFKNLVETNYTNTRNVKDYAEKLFISTKTLNQIVKEFTINTAKSFIDNFVILEAKREIVSTNKSFKEISFNIGFDEVTNFTKFFKRNLNITPKEFLLNQTS